MNALHAIAKLSPSATGMIRTDHAHVLTTFHKYDLDAAPGDKRALADTICLALEIHAELEEEIFYPAMKPFARSEIAKSVPEHDEMRRLIGALRAMDASDPEFDDTLMMLMREVLDHVAHEETVLLPDAERRLGRERLSELGAEMTQRRLALSAPRAGAMVVSTARSHPAAVIAGATALAVGAFVATRAIANARDTAR